MRERIRKVAVLGAGVMGSGIAAHMANAGVPCLMLDMVPKDLSDEDRRKGLTEQDRRFRNAIAAKGIEAIKKSRPPHLYDKRALSLVSVGNFEDDWERLADYDWIIEAVVERMDIKRSLFEKLEGAAGEHAIVSSNTSGLPISDMLEGRSESFRSRFLVSHFFNPVRYMYLLELVAGEDTSREVLQEIVRFGTYRLGKGIVFGKDTPNFVANRIGVFSMMDTLHAMLEMGYRVDEVDAITGPALGRPKSASFGTADLVGVDTFVHVVNTLREGCPEDESKDAFEIPDLLKTMVEKGALGRKAGAGFFKMEKSPDGKKNLKVLDYKTGDYVDKAKADIPSLKAARKVHDAGERIRGIVASEDRAGAFAWRILKRTLAYAAARIGEIADTVVDVDRGIKWGFNWELGPFEVWDALGVEETANLMEEENVNVAGWVWDMVRSGCPSFYREGKVSREYYDPREKTYVPEPRPEGFLILKDIKRATAPVFENDGASLVDLGDGVACVEFHSRHQPKMNPVDDEIIAVLRKGIEIAERDFRGLVIHHQGEQFCAGANLAYLLQASREKDWEAIDNMVRAFQGMTMGLRCASVPVIAAPFGFTFGGGAEITMGADRVCALAETYMGLVEVGVGLVPAGGGHLFMLERVLEGIGKPVLSNMPFIQGAFETIAMAKVGGSAEEARALKYLRPWDQVEIQKGLQLRTAKRMALALADTGYRPPLPGSFALPGKDGSATLRTVLHNYKLTHWISDHDEKVSSHIATILCGGDTTVNNPVSEETILELERAAFMSLCGEAKTQERIEFMLVKGKPLRN